MKREIAHYRLSQQSMHIKTHLHKLRGRVYKEKKIQLIFKWENTSAEVSLYGRGFGGGL